MREKPEDEQWERISARSTLRSPEYNSGARLKQVAHADQGFIGFMAGADNMVTDFHVNAGDTPTSNVYTLTTANNLIK